MIEHGCRRRTRSWGGAVGRNAKRTCDTQLLLPSVRKALHTEGKRSAPCMIRGVCAAKRAPSWQDLRAVCPPTAICGAFRMHGTHILPKPAHFEYTTAIYRHEGALFPSEAFFWDTPGQNIAIVRHPGTHNVNISPPPGAWECISRAYAAMPDRPMTHRGSISPAKPPFGYARGSMLVPTVPRPSPSAGCGGAQLRRWAPPR